MAFRIMITFLFINCINLLHGEQRVLATSPTDLFLRAGTESSPALTPFLGNYNAWGLTYNIDDDTYYTSDPTAGVIYSYGATSLASGVFVDQPGAVFHGLDAAGGDLYALRSGSKDLVKYDLPSNTPVVLATGLKRPNDVAVDIARDRIYVTDSGLDFLQIYTLSGTLLSSINFTGAWGVDVDETDGTVFISRYESGEVWRKKGNEPNFALLTTGLDGPRGLEVDRDGNVYVLEANAKRVVTLSRVDGSITATSYAEALNGHAMLVEETLDRDGDYLADSWEFGFESSLATIDGTKDSDSDTNSGMLEYAFRGDPTANEGSLFTNFFQTTGTGLSVSLPVRVDGDLLTEFFVSNNLVNWTPIAASLIEGISGTPDYEQYSFEIEEADVFPGNVTGRLFFRASAAPNR